MIRITSAAAARPSGEFYGSAIRKRISANPIIPSPIRLLFLNIWSTRSTGKRVRSTTLSRLDSDPGNVREFLNVQATVCDELFKVDRFKTASIAGV
jgi:hypothetical protein